MASTASGVQGMLAPSATAKQPFLIRALADSRFSSFWVAQGRAMSQGTCHTPEQPSWYSASGWTVTYSRIRLRSTSFSCFTSARSMPLGSWTKPLESDMVTTLAPRAVAFSQA